MSLEKLKSLTQIKWWHWSRLFGFYFRWRANKQEKKLFHKKAKEYQIVRKMRCSTVHHSGTEKEYTVDHVVYLLENGYGQRRDKIYSARPEELEYHKMYITIAQPWVDKILSTEKLHKILNGYLNQEQD